MTMKSVSFQFFLGEVNEGLEFIQKDKKREICLRQFRNIYKTLRHTVFGTFNFINELKFILLKASRKMQTRIKIKKKKHMLTI